MLNKEISVVNILFLITIIFWLFFRHPDAFDLSFSPIYLSIPPAVFVLISKVNLNDLLMYKFIGVFLLLICGVLLSSIFNSNYIFESVVYIVDILAAALAFLTTYSFCRSKENNTEILMKILVISALIASIFLIYMTLMNDNDYAVRMGAGGAKNSTAFNLVICLIFLEYLLKKYDYRLIFRVLFFIFQALIVVAIIISGSRLAMAILVILTAIGYLNKIGKLSVLLFLMAPFMYMLVTSGYFDLIFDRFSMDSLIHGLNARIDLYLMGLAHFMNQEFFGYLFGSAYLAHDRSIQPHNDFISILLYNGLFRFLILIFLVFIGLVRSIKLRGEYGYYFFAIYSVLLIKISYTSLAFKGVSLYVILGMMFGINRLLKKQ